MRLRAKHCLAILAVLTLTLPVWARTYKETINPEKDTMIGSTQLKAGSYDLSGDPAKKELQIWENGKVMATVQGQWVKLPQKAAVLDRGLRWQQDHPGSVQRQRSSIPSAVIRKTTPEGREGGLQLARPRLPREAPLL